MLEQLSTTEKWHLTQAIHNYLDRYTIDDGTYLTLSRIINLLEPQEDEPGQEAPGRTQRPTIVCLCGSTRFTDAYHAANLHETLAGNIVLSVGCDFKSDTDLLLAGVLTPADKERLDELHLRKIDMCDEILVINVDGYIGQSTSREIAYAEIHNKRVRYLEDDGAIAGNGKARRQFLDSVVDDAEYTAYVEHLHTPRASEY